MKIAKKIAYLQIVIGLFMVLKRKWILLFAAGLLCAITVSCKKEEEDTTLLTLTGQVKFDVPSYIALGSTHTMTPSGITYPDGNPVGWSWKVSPNMEKYDTTRVYKGSGDGSFTHTFYDSLTTFTITAVAFATDYYTSSTKKYAVAVKPGIMGGSITGVEPGENDFWFTDPRDGEKYLAGETGGLIWMKENLAWQGSGKGFKGYDITSHVFGRFYTWEEAQTACPEGWRLPSDNDWKALVQPFTNEILKDKETWSGVSGRLIKYVKFNGYDMWEFWPEVKADNAAGFFALSSGYANLATDAFSGLYDNATFWTSDEDPAQAENGLYRYIFCDKSELYIGAGDKKSFGANVRCVRDK